MTTHYFIALEMGRKKKKKNREGEVESRSAAIWILEIPWEEE